MTHIDKKNLDDGETVVLREEFDFSSVLPVANSNVNSEDNCSFSERVVRRLFKKKMAFAYFIAISVTRGLRSCFKKNRGKDRGAME